MKLYIKSNTWSDKFYTDKYSISDNETHPVSICNFSNGKTGVVFYDEDSYIVLDTQGKFYDGNACNSIEDAKQEAEVVAYY